MTERKLNTGFYSVFKKKLDTQLTDIKKELERAKSDRRKDWLKAMIHQTKGLRKTVKQLEEQMGTKTNCPHCGGDLH